MEMEYKTTRTYELLCQNSQTGKIYDITTLAGNIQYSTYLNGTAGTFTFSVQQDPNNLLQLVAGSIISFKVDGKGIFWGYIFKMGTDATGVYKITVYDQMRYLKNEDVYITQNMSASDIFTRICIDKQLKYIVNTPSTLILPTYRHEGSTLGDVIEWGIQRANIAEGKQYFIKDNFGTLYFTELAKHKTNLIIGDASLLTSYQYEISIDDATYNTVKIYRENETTGKRDTWIKFDSNNQKKWGTLQILQKATEEQNEAQIVQLADNLLKLHNRETKSMKLTALGVPELAAGSGFMFSLDKLGIKQDMWITKATHNYEKDYHTMSLEVFI